MEYIHEHHEHHHDHDHNHEHHNHEHGHEHHGHHHHHTHAIEKLSTIYIVAVALNLAFVIVEAVAGFVGNSLGLLSDAGHNLSDVFSLVLAMIALKLASSHATKRFTYGHRKASVLISLLNAIILLVAVGAIIVESVDKFFNPTEVNGSLIIWTATVGIVINGLTAWALSRQQKHDINTRGAFLHMLADTLVSVGVVVSGVVIKYTGWTVVDPIIGLVIAIVILVSTWSLLSESLRMSADAVPEGFDVDDITKKVEAVDGVLNVHHMHIWAISTTETALTCHIVIPEATMLEEVTDRVKELLDSLGIHHSTLELETNSSHCSQHDCC
ncbi:MAG: cation diffusion facilitator family transporter [Bacteroidales bacterium]|nr:cation diffusion facilitator family transporter [Bacteroidales bacterium]